MVRCGKELPTLAGAELHAESRLTKKMVRCGSLRRAPVGTCGGFWSRLTRKMVRRGRNSVLESGRDLDHVTANQEDGTVWKDYEEAGRYKAGPRRGCQEDGAVWKGLEGHVRRNGSSSRGWFGVEALSSGCRGEEARLGGDESRRPGMVRHGRTPSPTKKRCGWKAVVIAGQALFAVWKAVKSDVQTEHKRKVRVGM
jgi:hypothetical protein